MLIKAVAIGFVLATTPLCVVATIQDPATQEPGSAAAERHDVELETLRVEIDALRAALDRSEREAEAARARTAELETVLDDVTRQLGETLDMLDTSARKQCNNCTPSRGSLTLFQWMDRNGHHQRADDLLTEVLEERCDDTDDYHRLASHLLTDDECEGQFDVAALAIVERMRARGDELDHRQLDTTALALFLNGRIDEAVACEERAVAGSNNSEYRRRLRLFVAAQRAAASPGSAVEPAARPVTAELALHRRAGPR